MAPVYRRAATCWLCMIGAVLLVASRAPAQWVDVPQAAIPRMADGRPDLRAPTPRLPNGKPDLTGIWQSTDNKFLRDTNALMFGF